jgi:hypothetical protein
VSRIIAFIGVFGIAAALFWLPRSCERESSHQTAENTKSDKESGVLADKNESGVNQGGMMSNQNSTQESRQPQNIDPKEYFDSNFPGNWHAMKDNFGKVSTILGGKIPEVGASKESLLKFSRQVAPVFGAPVDQLGDVQTISESGLAEHYLVPQQVGLFRVYGAGLQFAVQKETKSVFQINNSLKEVASFDRNLQFNQGTAWTVVKGHFEGKKITRIDKNTDPVLYADNGPDNVELAWVFYVQVNTVGQYDEREVIVGAQSGDILLDIQKLVH